MADNEEQEIPEPSTAPFDVRFPNIGQMKSCWQNYIDFQKCVKAKGDEYEPCKFFLRNYRSLCPSNLVEKWDDEVEEGKFAGKI